MDGRAVLGIVGSHAFMPLATPVGLRDLPRHDVTYVWRALRKSEEDARTLRCPNTELLASLSPLQLRKQILSDVAHGNTHRSMFLHASVDYCKCRVAFLERGDLYSGLVVRIDISGFQPVIDLSHHSARVQWLSEAADDTGADMEALGLARIFAEKDGEVLICELPPPERICLVDPYTGKPWDL